MYNVHPSVELNALFASKPYQGVDPLCATFLFIGLDANYDATIERSPIFPSVLEYHRDGASFWRRHGVHHPFLLPGYTGDGQFYHRSFARIGFEPKHADLVSFIELLHVATVGRNQLDPDDLSPPHLRLINEAVTSGSARHVFVPSGVARLMRASKQFEWLDRADKGTPGALTVLNRIGPRTVYSHLHFSVYGKFNERKLAEAAEIRKLAVGAHASGALR